MAATFDRVLASWDFESLWGWDFPMMAMTAAALGRGEDALRLLLLDNPKNAYTANGHNRQADRDDLPLYLPGNGALLLSVAILATRGLFPAALGCRHEGLLPYFEDDHET
jgi:hypothetical protein